MGRYFTMQGLQNNKFCEELEVFKYMCFLIRLFTTVILKLKKAKIAKHRFQTLVSRNPKTLCVKILKLQVNMSPYFAKTMSRI